MDAVATGTASDEYVRRLAARQSVVDRLNVVDARVAYSRLAIFLVLIAAALVAWRGMVSAWIPVAPLGILIALVVYHDRVLHARAAAQRAIAYYDRGLARLEDRWVGTGESGDRFRDDEHLYGNDLDLFGRGSLFELLSVARTRPGEQVLADWLKRPASASVIAARHDAIRELTPKLDLRERLSLAGVDLRAGVDGDELVAWAEGARFLRPAWMRGVTVLLTIITLSTGAWFAVTGDPTPFEFAIVAQSVVGWARRHEIERALHAADRPARDLDVLSQVLETLERESFSAPQLVDIRQRLDTAGQPASTAIRRLHRLMAMHDWEHNIVFAPIGMLLQWGTHLAWAIETWRARHGAQIKPWLDAVAELEALSSLATYRYEHPDDPFAVVIDDKAALFDGDDLGHPLLPGTRMVRNSARIVGPTRLLVVSGSNMSGKSTFLRTVGINTVLALAGAPVRARALRLTPLAIGATLRIQDSLQEGRSRFYAEITRIRKLSDLAGGQPPLMFLLDELFHGTNSHDRLVGAAGVLRSLIDRGAIGLITTHDLALTAIADQLAPTAVNVHFEDWFEGGELRFDYRVKPGPVTRSNAIALMRAVGLDVEDADSNA